MDDASRACAITPGGDCVRQTAFSSSPGGSQRRVPWCRFLQPSRLKHRARSSGAILVLPSIVMIATGFTMHGRHTVFWSEPRTARSRERSRVGLAHADRGTSIVVRRAHRRPARVGWCFGAVRVAWSRHSHKPRGARARCRDWWLDAASAGARGIARDMSYGWLPGVGEERLRVAQPEKAVIWSPRRLIRRDRCTGP